MLGYQATRKLFLAFLCFPLFCSSIDAAETEFADRQEAAAIRKVIKDLRSAIRDKDFRHIKYETPLPRGPLFWGTCGFVNRSDLSFEAMINELVIASDNKQIRVNDRPEKILHVTSIETPGWGRENPYLYFDFKETGEGWRWLGVRDCFMRSSDFLAHQGKDALDETLPPAEGNAGVLEKVGKIGTLVRRLTTTARTKDFTRLRPYVPRERVYNWRPCGREDGDYEELSYEVMTSRLLLKSKDLKIRMIRNPDIRRGKDETALEVAIETTGWIEPDRFILFNFNLLRSSNEWAWIGACYSHQSPLKMIRP